MSKLGYIITFVCGVILFNSCSNRMETRQDITVPSLVKPELKKSYGAYMAGRVAHLRKNFDKAADYYIEAIKNNPNNSALISSVYLLLVSEGRVGEAAKYAKIAQTQGDENNFINIILYADNLKKNNYVAAEKELKGMNGVVYEQFIVPLLASWTYVERDGNPDANRKNALKKLEAMTLEFVIEVGERGKAFGSITNKEIAEELAKKGYDVDKKCININSKFARNTFVKF